MPPDTLALPDVKTGDEPHLSNSTTMDQQSGNDRSKSKDDEHKLIEKRHSSSVENSAKNGQRHVIEDEREGMRRSELIEYCVQTLAALKLCHGPCAASEMLEAQPLKVLRSVEELVSAVTYIMRPRRGFDDEAVERWELGPRRLEAFLRPKHDPTIREVYYAVRAIFPFIPHDLGWAAWEPRRQDWSEGSPTGGAIMSLRREVSVPPFVVGVVLRSKTRIPASHDSNDQKSGLLRCAVEFKDSTTHVHLSEKRCGLNDDPGSPL